MEEKIKEKLKEVMDPETGVSIVDMGFIYGIDVENGKADIEMTLTTPGCPLHSSFTKQVEKKVGSMKGIENVNVDVVFNPPWKPKMMSEKAKKKLGYMEE